MNSLCSRSFSSSLAIPLALPLSCAAAALVLAASAPSARALGTMLTIEFSPQNTGGDFMIDSLRVTGAPVIVPEPHAALLLLANLDHFI